MIKKTNLITISPITHFFRSAFSIMVSLIKSRIISDILELKHKEIYLFGNYDSKKTELIFQVLIKEQKCIYFY